MPTMSAAPASTVATATWPSSKRGTITSSVTQRTAHDEATVASANTVAPATATAKVRGCRPISARTIRSPRQRLTRGASMRAGVEATERFYQRRAPMAWGLPAAACHPGRVDHVDFGLLVLRLALGLTIAAHGTNKFFGGGRIPGTARWFESMGVRPGVINAILAATTEIVAGLGMALGLFTPLSAAGIIALMLVAIVVSHRKNGFFIFRPGEGWEYTAFLAVAAFSIATIGAGQWSLDHALGLDVEGWWGAAIALIVGLVGAALQLAACYRPPPPKPST